MALAFVLAVYGACRLGNDLGHPYRTPWDRTAREFARWFWEEMSADAEVVCVRSDLGIPFRSGNWAYDGADQYLCYQRIYSRRHREGASPKWHAISAKRPLRCVLLSRMPEEVPGFHRWIDEHHDDYTLTDVRSYAATRGSIARGRRLLLRCLRVCADFWGRYGPVWFLGGGGAEGGSVSGVVDDPMRFPAAHVLSSALAAGLLRQAI